MLHHAALLLRAATLDRTLPRAKKPRDRLPGRAEPSSHRSTVVIILNMLPNTILSKIQQHTNINSAHHFFCMGRTPQPLTPTLNTP